MSETTVTKALQSALVDLIDLSLQAKQAHWNIQGSRFRSLHLALDEITSQVRTNADDVAERVSALGGHPDGRARSVAEQSGIGDMASGALSVDKAYKEVEQKLQAASDSIKDSLAEVESADPLSGDMLIQIATGLEKQAWMLRAATVEA